MPYQSKEEEDEAREEEAPRVDLLAVVGEAAAALTRSLDEFTAREVAAHDKHGAFRPVIAHSYEFAREDMESVLRRLDYIMTTLQWVDQEMADDPITALNDE